MNRVTFLTTPSYATLMHISKRKGSTSIGQGYFAPLASLPPPKIFPIDLPNFSFRTGLFVGGCGIADGDGTLVLFFLFFEGGAGEAEVERVGSCVTFCFFVGGPAPLPTIGRGGGDIAFPYLIEAAGVEALLL